MRDNSPSIEHTEGRESPAAVARPEIPDLPETIRALSLVEATFVTGPAKSLIEFAAASSAADDDLPSVRNAVITFQRPSSENAFLESAERAGLKVDIIRERFAFDPGIIPQLRKAVREQQPEIIQSMNFKSHFLVRLLGLQRGRKWIAFHHGYTRTDLKNTLYNQLDRWSLRKADAVVTVCKPFAKELQQCGVAAERLVVQHNSIRPFVPATREQVERCRATLGLPPDAVVLLSVGRLSREKGHVDLIDAMAVVCRSAKLPRPLRLVIVGEGPERSAIEQRIAELKLREVVVLAGFQSEVAPYYQLAEIAVLPSHSEGSPYALLEAMAAGVAVAATSVGGVPEIAADGETAILANARQPAELAARILQLVQDPQLRERLGRAAQRRVKDFDPASYRRNMIELYKNVLSRPAR
ncbi:MAG: glycosyltransferase [Acidobacteriaceae bacterium]